MEFFVGNLIVAGLSDWGCVLKPTGLPAELIPHSWRVIPDDVCYYTSQKESCQQLFSNSCKKVPPGAFLPPAGLAFRRTQALVY
jgi:hypothetical protein